MSTAMKETSGSTKRLYTIPEVAHELSCSRSTVHNLIKTKQLRAVSLFSRKRISAHDLDAFVRQREEHARLLDQSRERSLW